MGVDLRKLVVAEKVDLESLRGKTIAVDAYNTLYQFLSIIRGRMGEPLMDGHGRVTSHLSGLFYRTANFVMRGIKLIYVFDGEAPALKEAEIKRRMAVKSEAIRKYDEARRRGRVEEARKYAQRTAVLKDYMAEDAKKLLTLMGVPWVQAPSEGEAQAAYIVSRGDAWAAGSQDFDALLFGANRLVRNLSITGRRKLPRKNLYIKIMPEVIEMSKITSSLDLTREQLIEIGILLGTDYNPAGIKGIGPKSALDLVKKHGSVEKIMPHLKEARFPVHPSKIREMFLRPQVVTDYSLQWRRPLVDETVEFLCRERDFSEDRVRKALDKIEQGAELAHPKTLEDFMSHG